MSHRPKRARVHAAPAPEAPVHAGRVWLLSAATLLLVWLAGCGGEKGRTPDQAAASSTGAVATPAGTTPPVAVGDAASPPNLPGGPCYLREVWDECGLIKRLENTGYVPKVDGREAGALGTVFHAPYVKLTLGRGTLHAFIYPTAAAATADLAKADTVGQSVCPPARTARYGGSLLHSANLIAFLEADNENTCVRIGDLVTAGLPKLERR